MYMYVTLGLVMTGTVTDKELLALVFYHSDFFVGFHGASSK